MPKCHQKMNIVIKETKCIGKNVYPTPGQGMKVKDGFWLAKTIFSQILKSRTGHLTQHPIHNRHEHFSD